MATQKIVETDVPVERVTTTEVRSGGGAGNAVAIILGFIVLAAVIIGGFLFWNWDQNDSTPSRDVSHAASNVSNAADRAVSGAANTAGNVADAATR